MVPQTALQPHALALGTPKQFVVLQWRAEPPAQPLLGHAGTVVPFGSGGPMHSFFGHASSAAATGEGCWTQRALPRGRLVCKQPLCLQPGPGRYLRCFGGDFSHPCWPYLLRAIQIRVKLVEEPAQLCHRPWGTRSWSCTAARMQCIWHSTSPGTAHADGQLTPHQSSTSMLTGVLRLQDGTPLHLPLPTLGHSTSPPQSQPCVQTCLQ